MKTKTLNNGFSLPNIGLGTWHMGGAREVDSSRDAEWIAAIKAAIGMGYTHIDTAAMYGVGHCEELVHEAIKDVNREKLIIATKVFPSELSYDNFRQSFAGSLERLRLNYVDLLYIHGPNPDIPLSETMRAMNEVIDSGQAKYLAVSNFSVDQLKEAQSLTDHKIVANQVEYNLLTRNDARLCKKVESEVLPYCQENDILVVAYKPVNRGTLLEPHPLVDELAEKYHVTRAQLAINWLVSQANVVTIPKSDNPVHLKENFAAGEWQMDKEHIERLRQDYSHA